MVDQFAAATGFKMVELLQGLGLDCFYPPDLTDCGMVLYNQGDRDGAKTLGERMINQYEDCDCIVSCGSAAVAYMKVHFRHLFHNTTFHNNYRHFVDKLFDISDFLVNVKHFSPKGVRFPHRVAFMDHCTTRRDYVCTAHPDRKGLVDDPRELLRSVEGLELVEMEQGDVCCGFGGLFANQFAPVSDEMARRKAENAIAAGAEYITSTEMSCLLHLQSYIDKVGLALKCVHLVDIITGEDVKQ